MNMAIVFFGISVIYLSVFHTCGKLLTTTTTTILQTTQDAKNGNTFLYFFPNNYSTVLSKIGFVTTY